jgi:hypothetical protein
MVELLNKRKSYPYQVLTAAGGKSEAEIATQQDRWSAHPAGLLATET